MTNAVATTNRNVPAWRGTLDKAMPSIIESLPAHVTPEKFQQVAATAIGRTPMLKQCMESNPQKVLLALSDCASDGLMPNGKEAALVPFNDRKNNRLDLTYIPMISGVLKRMRQSGEVSGISARIVHENDVFEYHEGDDERLRHVPAWQDRGNPVGAYAIIKLRSGEIYREVMSKSDILAVKNASKARGGPWSGPFELEMWRKTVLKRAAKYCPFSDERMQVMLDRDNELYDMDRAQAPKRSLLESFAEDENPPVDVAGEEEDIIDVVPSSYDHGDEEGAAPLPENEAAPSTDPEPEAKPAPSQNTEKQKFYVDTMRRMKNAKLKDERVRILDEVSRNPLWKELDEPKQNKVIEAAE